jgi:hypothetical protein
MTTPRLARPADAERLFALIVSSEDEWTLAPRNYDRIRAVLDLALDRSQLLDLDGMPVMRPAFGVIEGEMGIEGACGLHPTQPWDSDALYLRGFFLYVHQACRRSTHAKMLIHFGHQFADVAQMTLIWELLHPERTEAKAKLFARQAPSVGGLYRHEPLRQALAA